VSDGGGRAEALRYQAEFIEAETAWIASRPWYRMLSRITNPLGSARPGRRDGPVELSRFRAQHDVSRGQQFVGIEMRLLRDSGENPRVGKLVLQFSEGRRTEFAVQPDRDGCFRVNAEIPVGCREIIARFKRTRTRRQVFVKYLIFSNEVPPLSTLQESTAARPHRVALYGDLDLNVVDGSAIWLVSLASALSMTGVVNVDLILKRQPVRDTVIKPLIADPAIRIMYCRDQAASFPVLDAWLRKLDELTPAYSLILVRGFKACSYLARQAWLSGRLAPYITDLPQVEMGIADADRQALADIAGAARLLLCQTSEIQSFYVQIDPGSAGKAFLLPPMIPELPPASSGDRKHQGFRVVYAGKFAPEWAIEQMLDAFASLRRKNPGMELHVFGDKFQGDRSFTQRVRQRLRTDEGIRWYGAVSRNDVLERLQSMDIAWSWRLGSLEDSTRELSTKVLEYGCAGLPVILYGNEINREVLGPDYPLFAGSAHEAESLLGCAVAEPEMLESASERVLEAARPYGYGAAAERLRLLFESAPQTSESRSAAPAGHDGASEKS